TKLFHHAAQFTRNDPTIIRNAAEVEFLANRPNSLEYESERPVVGYFGAISSWFDIDMVTDAAEHFPEWNFVLVGSTLGCNIERALPIPNIHFMGEVPYSTLP